MRVVLEGETRIRLEMRGEAFEISSERVEISPYHLLAASLASCTVLTAASWAHAAGVGTERLTVEVAWRLVEGRPKRVDQMDMTLHWPELPEGRRGAAARAAGLCPIHHTLAEGTRVTTRIDRG